MGDTNHTKLVPSLTFVPGATGPLPSHARAHGKAPVTVSIPPIRIRYPNGTTKVWTRMQINRETGISLTTISKLFTGSRKPSLKMAQRLAAYFGVTIERLTSEILPHWEMKMIPAPTCKRGPAPYDPTKLMAD